MNSEFLDDYLKTAESFVQIANNLDQARLNKSNSTQEWSGAFIIHHQADFEVHFTHRLLLILTSDNPLIESYDESSYPQSLAYEKRDVADSLNSLVANRKLIFNILSNLDETIFDRPARHAVKGDVTLKNIMQYANGHLKDHTEQLKNTIA